MKNSYIHDQRGVAMLLELVLVAAVLGLVGVAVYQSSHNSSSVASQASTPAPAASSTASLVSATAATVVADSASDAAISASADSTASEVTSSDADAANLGATLNANSF